MLHKLKARLRRENFLVTPLSILIHHYYIIRHGLFQSIRRAAPAITGDVLDFGCGSKPYEPLFTNARTYIGVDIEVSGHDHARSKVDVFYDGRTIPFADEQFESVVCFEVFEHVFNLDEVLSEIKRVTKQSGKLLITIPFAWDEHEIPYDFARYTSYGIRYILEQHGFEIVTLEKTTTYVLALSALFIAYLHQYVLPKGRILGRVAHLAVIFPITVLALLLNAVLPKRYEYFCNTIVLCRKR